MHADSEHTAGVDHADRLDDAVVLGARLDAHSAQQADALKARWVLEDMRGADLLAAARQAI